MEILSRHGVYVVLRAVQRLIEPLRLAGQKYEMHKRVDLDDEKQDWSHKEEGGQGKLNVEERQFHGTLEKEIDMRFLGRCHREIEQNEEI